MAYKNPVPVLLDSPVSKKVCISFTFGQYVTAYEAAEAISRFIAEEYKGTIPEQWVRLEEPTYSVCEEEYFNSQ